jgi:hypothetical protein
LKRPSRLSVLTFAPARFTLGTALFRNFLLLLAFLIADLFNNDSQIARHGVDNRRQTLGLGVDNK